MKISDVRSSIVVRRASPADAAGIAAVMQVIAAERIHSAIDRAWTVGEQQRHMEFLSSREAFHVAVDEGDEGDEGKGIVGLQIVERWSPGMTSMAHVGQVGTFLLPAFRRRGIGQQLWNATRSFASEAGYRKLVIQVRGANTSAQAFYQGLGFLVCGRLTRQVVIDGVDDDEVLMEFFV